MKIFISDSKGEKIPIDNLSGSTLVKELKQQIITIKNVTILPIQLIYNGNLFEDEEKLEEYDIEDGVTITFLGEFIAGSNKLNSKLFLCFYK